MSEFAEYLTADSPRVTSRKKKKLEAEKRKIMEKIQHEKKLKKEREEKERLHREKILSIIVENFKKAKNKQLRSIQKLEEKKEWERYISKEVRPYPEQPPHIRKHFNNWLRKSKYADFDTVNADLEFYLPLFDLVKEITDLPLKSYTKLVPSLREVMNEWKIEFLKKIDYATFLIMKDMKKFSRINFYTRNLSINYDLIKVEFWAFMDVPLRSDLIIDEIRFPNIELEIKLPNEYKLKPIVIRVLYSRFDFYSDRTKTRFLPCYSKTTDLLSEVRRCEALTEKILTEIERENKKKEEEISSRRSSRSEVSKNVLADSSSLSSKLSESSEFERRYFSSRVSFSKFSFDAYREKALSVWSFKTVSSRRGSMARGKAGSFFQDVTFLSNLETNSSQISSFDKESIIKTNSDISLVDYFQLLFPESSGHKSIAELVSELKPSKGISFQTMESLSTIFLNQEKEKYQQFVSEMTIETDKFEINLRKYHSFSGVYSFHVFQQMGDVVTLKNKDAIQIDSTRLKTYPELSKFPLTIQLSDEVFWFEKPLPALWDDEKQHWTNEFVSDVVYKEKKINFNVAKFGPITFFTYRFHELPYKSWSLCPDEDDFILLSLQGQNFKIEFKIGDQICLNGYTGDCGYLLEDFYGKFKEVDKLVEELRSLGLDVFPENDTFLYVPGWKSKPPALEEHVYFSMAMYAKVVEFASSDWNHAAGPDEIMLQCRLHCIYDPIDFRTLKVNRFKSEVLTIDEKSGTFSSESASKEYGFFPDVYSLLSRFYQKNFHYLNTDLSKAYTIYNILTKIKVLTFSGDPEKTI